MTVTSKTKEAEVCVVGRFASIGAVGGSGREKGLGCVVAVGVMRGIG